MPNWSDGEVPIESVSQGCGNRRIEGVGEECCFRMKCMPLMVRISTRILKVCPSYDLERVEAICATEDPKFSGPVGRSRYG